MYRSFEDLVVWKRACHLAVQVYAALGDCREFGIRDQMQRAAVSIASNIAEGSERTPRDFKRFLRMAAGSAAELRTQAYIAFRIGVLSREQMRGITDESKQIAKMLSGLAATLKLKTEI